MLGPAATAPTLTALSLTYMLRIYDNTTTTNNTYEDDDNNNTN